MPMELQGALIEMNVCKVLPKSAQIIMVCSVVLIVICLAGLLANLTTVKSRKNTMIFAVLTIFSITTFFIGFCTPYVRQIEYCAVGPVSIEEVNERFDIVEIDGKKIVVQERRPANEHTDQAAG